MRVLVTGARGFVGTALVNRLTQRQHQVSAIDRDELDVCDASSVDAFVKAQPPDAVVHLAGQSSVARSFADPVGTYRSNVLGTVCVLAAVQRHAPTARVVVASSAEVYGCVELGDLPVHELHPTRPANPYGGSKLAMETAALQYRDALGLDVIVARSFNAVGPGQSIDFAIPSFAAQLAAISRGDAEPVLRVGNLDVTRDLIDVRDAACALDTLATEGVPSGVYNICAETGVSIQAALDELVRLSGLQVVVVPDPTRMRPVDIPVMVGSAGRLRAATGFEPRVPLEQSLADLLASVGFAGKLTQQ